jgi:hypothetical protein
MMIEDGMWSGWRSRLALYGLLARLFARMTPGLLRILLPNYDPRHVKDPAWAVSWWRQHDAGEQGLGELDMARIGEPAPAVRPAQDQKP